MNKINDINFIIKDFIYSKISNDKKKYTIISRIMSMCIVLSTIVFLSTSLITNIYINYEYWYIFLILVFASPILFLTFHLIFFWKYKKNILLKIINNINELYLIYLNEEKSSKKTFLDNSIIESFKKLKSINKIYLNLFNLKIEQTYSINEYINMLINSIIKSFEKK